MSTEDLEYEVDGVAMIGRLALPDDASAGPAVLVAHGAPGLDPFFRSRAEAFAKEGYAALAIDYHGGGKVMRDPVELAARLEAFSADPDAFRRLVAAGLAALVAQSRVDPRRIAAVGYCFGAVAVMELARTGADLRAVIGFHPGLSSFRPADSRNITGRVLMCVGADDPIVPKEARATFEDEMREANVHWEMHLYSGVKHRFTDPDAASAGSPALAYDRRAAEHSWRAMLDLLGETIGRP